jgi:hypothetical protein
MSGAAGPAWLFKGVRTLLSAAPGLTYFALTADGRGVALAFAALCLSVRALQRSRLSAAAS